MQTLPAKDQAVFRSIVKFYETKQYKKGVKAADSILKKHPEHGETLCMKGLTLSYLDKKDEAYLLVKKGLKHDMRSHVCWHVFGLLYRQDRDYLQAVNCYKQALRIDPDNIQILRDLSLLQIHRRDLTGFAETRRKLLQVKPGNRLNWVGYAISEHLCNEFEFAWTCIDNYENTFKDETVPEYENSEMFLYKATIMEEAGKFEEACDCLNKHDKEIVSRLEYDEMKGRLCIFLGKYDEAAEIFRKLVNMNPEHHVYVLALMASTTKFHRFWPPLPPPTAKASLRDGLIVESGKDLPATISSFPASMHPEGTPIWGWLPPTHSLKPDRRIAIGNRQHKRRLDAYNPLEKLSDEEQNAVMAFFDELQAAHPKADSLQRLSMYFLAGQNFKKRLDEYLRPRIRKGVPSLFRIMRPLYFQDGKPELIEKLLLQYIENLSEDVAWFGPKVGETDAAPPSEENEESPASLLFTYMIMSEHFDFIGEPEKALMYADKGIDHTPTFVEIYGAKARIYKHAGDFEQSAHWANEVRSMDLADRFLNGQCVRAYLRKDDVPTGAERALLFSQSKDPDGPESSNLHDMQAMWYESAVGRSYCRQKNYGKALKEFQETFKHFTDIGEDQFDFHNYCLRKTTLKSYVAMLRMQEKLYSHKFYRRAAKETIRIYMELFDQKARKDAAVDTTKDDENKEQELSAEEKKKQKHAAKRAKKKDEPIVLAKAGATSSGGKPKKVDDDPNGDKLLAKDPMEESAKHVRNLVLYSSGDPASHVLTYEVFSRQGKALHCLQAVVKLWNLAGCDMLNYKLIASLSHFCFVMKLEGEGVSKDLTEVFLSEIAPVFNEKAFSNVAALRKACTTKVVDAVEKKIQKTPELPVIEVLYGVKCLKHAGRDCKKLLEQWEPKGAFALKECRKMLEYVEAEYGKDAAGYVKFAKRMKEVFPLMVM